MFPSLQTRRRQQPNSIYILQIRVPRSRQLVRSGGEEIRRCCCCVLHSSFRFHSLGEEVRVRIFIFHGEGYPSSYFLMAYGKDIINILHGLLPSFKGGYPSKQIPCL